MFKYLLIFGIVASKATCQNKQNNVQNQEKQLRRAAYFWKSNFELDSASQAWLKTAQVNTLYTKLFEVTSYYGKPEPSASIQLKKAYPGLNIVPVIFIDPSVFRTLETKNIKTLAYNIMKKAGCIPELNNTELGPNRPFKELQIDCDWPKKEQEKYFALLKAIKQVNPKLTLSVTLRLYAYKYNQEMGVPPVDRCMLMPYNIERPDEKEGERSIYNQSKAAAYFGSTSYPLPLDVALPNFAWLKVYNEEHFSRLYRMNSSNLPRSVKEKTAKTSQGYEVTAEIPWNREIEIAGYPYFNKGEKLYLDQPTKEDLKHIAQISKVELKGSFSVCMFSMDDYLYNEFGRKEDLDEIFEAFAD